MRVRRPETTGRGSTLSSSRDPTSIGPPMRSTVVAALADLARFVVRGPSDSASVTASGRSLFRYFHGRSSLTTWLRAVLAQRYVDRLRTIRRTEALPDEESADACRPESDARP